MGFCQNIPTRFWASFFQNFNFFHFSWHIIRLVCRMVTIFLLTQRTRSDAPFRYLEHIRKVHRKFSRGPWKKWKKLRFWKNEAQNRVGIFWQNPIFWAETFFQRPLENFLLAWRTCSRYLKGPPNLVLCVSKKIVTIRHTNKKIFANNRQKTPFWQTSFGTTVDMIGEAC